jgi:hypothetical protein
MASMLGRPTELARRAVVEHPYDLGRSSSGCCGPFGQAIWSPGIKPAAASLRSKPSLSVTRSERSRTAADPCRPAQRQLALLMKFDLDPSGIPMLSWVPIVFGGRGGCSHRETGSSTDSEHAFHLKPTLMVARQHRNSV